MAGLQCLTDQCLKCLEGVIKDLRKMLLLHTIMQLWDFGWGVGDPILPETRDEGLDVDSFNIRQPLEGAAQTVAAKDSEAKRGAAAWRD